MAGAMAVGATGLGLGTEASEAWVSQGARMAMDIFLWLFLASAGVGVWAAYDRGPAWAVFWLLVGAVGLYYAIAASTG